MSEACVMERDWLKEAAKLLGGEATVLLQGFPYSGFGTLSTEGELSIPGQFGPPDFDHSWDLRIFRDSLEIYAWRTGPDGWAWRLADPDNWTKSITGHQILWGTAVSSQDAAWRLLSESRGARVWLPPSVTHDGPELALRIIERVEPEPSTGLAGIVDAMIAEIIPAKELQPKGDRDNHAK
jgi:CRISPR-associated protein (TIGR03984 family)